jgi:hypothetical protein
MKFDPTDTLPPATMTAIVAAYGLGEPIEASFVARGAMGAVNRLRTRLNGAVRDWTVKRSYWNHYAEPAIEEEVTFTRACAEAGVVAPQSLRRIADGAFVTAVDDQTGGSQYRVLEWVDGVAGGSGHERTIPALMGWLARIHTLALSTYGKPVDPWFIRISYDWGALAVRLEARAPEIARLLREHRAELDELTGLVNRTPEARTIWCHTDIGASNLIWSAGGPVLIDWENSGALVPRQELGLLIRSLGDDGRRAYDAYLAANGPERISTLGDLTTSVAVHLNYLGVQAELLLDDEHPEQHDFARSQVESAAASLPTIGSLDAFVAGLQ